MREIDVPAALQRQLSFIKNSCDLYDRGFEDEAIRIATAIRVILHDTAASTSILSLLAAKDISLVSSVGVVDERGCVAFSGALSFIRAKMENSNEGPPTIEASALPLGVEALASGCVMQADEWWNQVIYIFPDGGRYSRKDLILDAANKDGGAHVNKSKMLPPIYAKLARNFAASRLVSVDENQVAEFSVQIFCNNDGPDGVVVKNMQYADLRQMANELMHSQELVALSRVDSA